MDESVNSNFLNRNYVNVFDLTSFFEPRVIYKQRKNFLIHQLHYQSFIKIKIKYFPNLISTNLL